jgi:SOS-response transcriptional repressor LexA
MSNDRSYLALLQDYYAEHRVLPSYASIGQLLGLKSKSSVAAMVARLKLAGFIDSTPDRRLAPTTIDDYLIEHPSQTVLVRVKGDSMIDAGILEGDLVVIEKSSAAKRGDIVIAIVDGQFTLKRLDLEKGAFVLKPENPAYPVIRPEGTLEVFGVMVGLVRKI